MMQKKRGAMTLEELISEDKGDHERLRALLPMLQAQVLHQESVLPAPIAETVPSIGWPGNLRATNESTTPKAGLGGV